MLRTATCLSCIGGWLADLVARPASHRRRRRPPRRPAAARSLVTKPGVLVIAHRGDSKVAPENTLPAFASAVKAGADLVELDYLHSADGVPVVFHDGELDRTTNACQLWGGEKIRLDQQNAWRS